MSEPRDDQTDDRLWRVLTRRGRACTSCRASPDPLARWPFPRSLTEPEPRTSGRATVRVPQAGATGVGQPVDAELPAAEPQSGPGRAAGAGLPSPPGRRHGPLTRAGRPSTRRRAGLRAARRGDDHLPGQGDRRRAEPELARGDRQPAGDRVPDLAQRLRGGDHGRDPGDAALVQRRRGPARGADQGDRRRRQPERRLVDAAGDPAVAGADRDPAADDPDADTDADRVAQREPGEPADTPRPLCAAAPDRAAAPSRPSPASDVRASLGGRARWSSSPTAPCCSRSIIPPPTPAGSPSRPFAELERAPEHIHTYRLTPLGLWNARAAGHDAEQVVDTLLTLQPLPGAQRRCWSTSPTRWTATGGCGSRSTRPTVWCWSPPTGRC